MALSIITVTGELGSGKSTIAGMLQARMPGCEVYSSGALFRSLALEMGLTVAGLTELAETDASIDATIDGRLMELGKSGRNLIVDSRMAWHFIPESFKVYVDVDIEKAIDRIMAARRGSVETYGCREEAMKNVLMRRESERRRYLEKYGVDVRAEGNYDLVVDTTGLTVDEAVEIVWKNYTIWTKRT